jgi:hypothetical protein
MNFYIIPSIVIHTAAANYGMSMGVISDILELHADKVSADTGEEAVAIWKDRLFRHRYLEGTQFQVWDAQFNKRKKLGFIL